MTSNQTTLEKLNNNPEILKAMLSMPEEANAGMVESRRDELFSFMWETLDMERDWVVEKLKEQEEQFIEEYKNMGVPEWLLRMEAQDVILENLYKKFKERGVID